MRLFVVILMFFVCGYIQGCDQSEYTQKMEKREKELRIGEVQKGVLFLKHEDSGLCFAFYGIGHQAGLATVPCEDVEHLLEKDQ